MPRRYTENLAKLLVLLLLGSYFWRQQISSTEIVMVDEWAVFWKTALISVLPTGIAVYWYARRIKMKDWLFRWAASPDVAKVKKLAYLILILGLVPTTTYVAVLHLNNRIDQSPAIPVSLLVTNKTTSSGSRPGITHYIYVDASQRNWKNLRLNISERLYDNVRPGQNLPADLRPGWLGFEWLHLNRP